MLEKDTEELLKALEAAQEAKEEQIVKLEAEKELLFAAWMKITSLKSALARINDQAVKIR
jgi:hypothetical protein